MWNKRLERRRRGVSTEGTFTLTLLATYLPPSALLRCSVWISPLPFVPQVLVLQPGSPSPLPLFSDALTQMPHLRCALSFWTLPLSDPRSSSASSAPLNPYLSPLQSTSTALPWDRVRLPLSLCSLFSLPCFLLPVRLP